MRLLECSACVNATRVFIVDGAMDLLDKINELQGTKWSFNQVFRLMELEELLDRVKFSSVLEYVAALDKKDRVEAIKHIEFVLKCRIDALRAAAT